MSPRLQSVLTGLRVIDLTQARAGPTAARQLADWGADVIRIEPPRDSMYADLGKRHGPDFQNLHRNKRGLALDLKMREGLDVLHRLASRADVLLENFRPDVKARLGFDYPRLCELNPRLVYGSISGFGQDGPCAHWGGLDQIVQGMGGHMSITGEPGRGPMKSGAAINDMFAGILCANAVLMALLDRERSGQGQWVSTSLIEAQLFMLDFQAARWTMNGDEPTQDGNHHSMLTPMGVFATRDGHINIAPLPRMWGRFCEVLGVPEMKDDPDYRTPEDRQCNRARLIQAIEAITRSRDSDDWVAAFNRADVPCGPIYSIKEAFDNEQVRHLGIVQTVHSASVGRDLNLVGQPLHMSQHESRIAAPAPACGEHTDEILAEEGYSQAEISHLREIGAVL